MPLEKCTLSLGLLASSADLFQRLSDTRRSPRQSRGAEEGVAGAASGVETEADGRPWSTTAELVVNPGPDRTHVRFVKSTLLL